jgi:4-amino-4-deoxy-L-arabinose transferase-like glycosyltransferase
MPASDAGVSARRAAWIVLSISIGVRLVVAALVPLTPDESYYWEWSRHLAAGYFDHPPGIALVVWFGTALLGDTALGVRLGCVLAGAIASMVLVWIAGEMGGDRARLRAAAILACMPLTQIWLGIATPDPPLMLSWSLALAALVYALRDGVSARDFQAGGWGIG